MFHSRWDFRERGKNKYCLKKPGRSLAKWSWWSYMWGHLEWLEVFHSFSGEHLSCAAVQYFLSLLQRQCPLQYMNYPAIATWLYRGKVTAVDSSVLQRDRNKMVMNSAQAWTQSQIWICKEVPLCEYNTPFVECHRDKLKCCRRWRRSLQLSQNQGKAFVTLIHVSWYYCRFQRVRYKQKNDDYSTTMHKNSS